MSKPNSVVILHEGDAEGVYPVSIGKKGVGKKKKGDNKTPLGKYALGKPRSSKKFHIFIPIGYPTAEQKQQGYTGSAIGIHGPSQPWRWLGGLNTLFNVTQGCVMVGHNEDIEEISAWASRNRPEFVFIE
jgi:murein L,D-transpeptidase YafK